MKIISNSSGKITHTFFIHKTFIEKTINIWFSGHCFSSVKKQLSNLSKKILTKSDYL